MKHASKSSSSLIDWPELLDPYARQDCVASTFLVSPQALARVAQISITASELHYLQCAEGSPFEWLVAPSSLSRNIPPIIACLNRSMFLETMFRTLIAAEAKQ